MPLGAIGLFLLGTAAGISAPIISREVVSGTQRVLGGDIDFAGKRLVGKTAPVVEKEISTAKARSADVAARKNIARSLKFEREVNIFGLRAPNVNIPFLGGSLAGAQYAVPGARAFRSEQYESTVISNLIKQGYSREKARRMARIMAERFRAESAGEASGAVITSTLSEAGGAALAQAGFKQAGAVPVKAAARTAGKTVAKAAGLAGIFEGVSMDIMSQAAPVFYGR